MPRATIPRGLNKQQRDAVKTTEGPLLVLAGAGTGKTRTVTERISYLLRKGTPPENILAVTFTNKAAGEMKERLQKMVGREFDLRPLIASTFHSLCVRILRRDADKLGYRPGFSICDTGDQIGLIRKAMKHISGGISKKPDDVLYEIGQLKNQGLTPQAFARSAVEDWEQTLASIYRRYQEGLQRINAFDFDDLLLKTVQLLEQHKDALQHWSKRFQYISVDEFQDTNGVQLRMVELLASHWNNLCVVGDDDQSIYGWRGAVADNILKFDQRFPKAKTVRLEENYRSVNSILKASNALIANNENRCVKTLWSSLGDGDPIRVWACNDQNDEAERIVSRIKNRLMEKTGKPDQFAIILRTNAQTRLFEEELRTARIPYTIIGGQSFYDFKETKDMLSYLTALANPRDDSALLRIINTPARGIGDKTIDSLSNWALQQNLPLSKALLRAGEAPLSDKPQKACLAFAGQLRKWQGMARKGDLANLVETIIDESDYIHEVEGLYDDPLEQGARINMARDMGDTLRNFLSREPESGLIGFLQEAALWGKEDETAKEKEKNQGSVKLITAHSAKGLEFPYVYIAGMEEGLMPHKNSEEANTLDEERRLAYVALTRAQKELTLTYCRTRQSRGKGMQRTPSRFLTEIPPELLDRRDEEVAQKETIDAIRALRERLASRE